jgi:coproporphyrinogen III oxidase
MPLAVGSEIRREMQVYVQQLQDRICEALELADGSARFEEDLWERPGGGGGRSRVLTNGAVLEKAGVSTSAVWGELTDPVRHQLGVRGDGFFATGVSLVLHPRNPHAPTVHANFRYFDVFDHGQESSPRDAWVAGGSDLTPWILYPEDAVHFHRVLREATLPFGTGLYERYKAECDAYFRNHHRNEARGIGGLFFDYLRDGHLGLPLETWYRFVRAQGDAFLPAYLPVLQRRKDLPFTPEQRRFQEIRRGRYVEFNLIHDKGTLFGLKTNGRTESILMSLPPVVQWVYNENPEPGTPEAALLEVLRYPRNWLDEPTEPQ